MKREVRRWLQDLGPAPRAAGLARRVIACLDVDNGVVVKGTQLFVVNAVLGILNM